MKKTLDFFGGDELRARIFWEKYALRDEKGNVLEETPEDMWRRILAALGLNDNPDFWWLLSDFRFVPGGRILHAVGNEFQKCTCFNCYFIPIKEDSIEAIYECAKEMARTYSYGGGVGCVAKGSYVITRNGVKRIEEVQEGEEVLSYNPTLQQPEFRQVLKVHRPIVKRKDNVAIYLKDGTRIVTSRWHPTLVFREDKFQYIPAGEVRPGDAMVSTPELHTLPLNCERLHNPEIAWWTGAHIGDGCAYKEKEHPHVKDYMGRGRERRSTTLKFYNKCKEVAQEYARIYNKYTNSEVCAHLSQRGLYEVTTSSHKAGDIIDKYVDGIYGKKALQAKIPRWIWNASRESQLAFLAGLIDTDGSINASASRLEFHTSSKELAYGLKTLLALLGARAWIKVRERNHQGRNSVVQRCEPSYSICLPALPIVKEIARYMVNPEKKKRLMNMRFPHNNRDIVAVPPVVQRFLEQYAQRKTVGLSRYRLLAGLKKRGWVNRKLFLRVIDAVIEKTQDPNVYYQALAFRRLCLSLIPVEKVVPEVDVDEEFCDLTVEGNNNYFAGEGGLTVIHNTDISVLRPAGAVVRNTARYSTGAVSFMELYSLTTGTIGQHFRRGALMITIEDWHPDVLDFVKIKRNLTSVRYANISVKVSDEFMEAVKRGRKWWLRFEGEGFKVEKKIDARELMDEIVKSAHGWAEPGVIFWSTMKRNSNSEYFHPLLGTNPCSEIGLPAYGACNLAAINLYKFVKNPFTEHAYFDFEEFKKAVRLGVRFLDAVIDYADAANKYPLEAQRETENRERRLGLGIMGLADMFLALCLKYDSEEAVEFAEKVFTVMRDTAYDESVNLAIEKGPFPAFDWEGYSQSEFIKRLPRHLKERIRKHGIRNVALLTIAPTGSIGTMAGVSTGIEPIFQVKYYRRSESLSQKEFEVFHPTVNDYFKVTGRKELPPHLVTAHEIDPIMRVEMQATIQAFIDNAISSTVNLPKDISPKAVEDIYFEAWKRGCKGITVYREGSREDILRIEKEKSEPKRTRFVRPASLNAEVFKYRTEAGNVYITISKDNEGKPREVFINIGKSGSTTAALGEALGRILSISLQYDVPPQELIQQLRLIRSGSWERQPDGTVVFSIPDAVGRALAKACGEENNGNHLIIEEIRKEKPEEVPQIDGMTCPECGGIMIRLGGCSACVSCSYTRCD